MAHSEGFEPSTARFVAEYSIQLSYECVEGAYGNEFAIGRQVILFYGWLCSFIGQCLVVCGAFYPAYLGPFPCARAVIVCGDSWACAWGLFALFVGWLVLAFILHLAGHPGLGGLITLLFLSGALIE